MPKEEDVIVTDFLGDLDIRAIDSANKQSTVEAELHVRCTRGLRTSCRDMLGNVRGWDENFGKRNGIVRQEEKREVFIRLQV